MDKGTVQREKNVQKHVASCYTELTASPLPSFSTPHNLTITLGQQETSNYGIWHRHIEVNIPFDAPIELQINNNIATIAKGQLCVFWGSLPHRLTQPNKGNRIAVIYIPMHLFLSWPLPFSMVNNITDGTMLTSISTDQLSIQEATRWYRDTQSDSEWIRQLAVGDIARMMQRFGTLGWEAKFNRKNTPILKRQLSKHSLCYVSQILEYIAQNFDNNLSIQEISDHVRLNPHYAMDIFQKIMQMTIKNHITYVRLNHVKVLLSETDLPILDVALHAGFQSTSRFYSAFNKHVGIPPGKYRTLSKSRTYNPIRTGIS